MRFRNLVLALVHWPSHLSVLHGCMLWRLVILFFYHTYLTFRNTSTPLETSGCLFCPWWPILKPVTYSHSCVILPNSSKTISVYKPLKIWTVIPLNIVMCLYTEQISCAILQSICESVLKSQEQEVSYR